ncbi:MAG: heavy metal translocating P-type ATPase [Phycisphaeraceae bacterium]
MPRTTLQIDGMHCASCVARVEKALRHVEGVEDATVNLTTNKASVEGNGLVTDALIQSVERAGYQAQVIDQAQRPSRETANTHDAADSPKPGYKWFSRSDAFQRVLINAPFAIGVMALDMAVHTPWSPWAQFAIATLLIFALGTPFFVSAVRGLRYRRVDMDTLIALGSGVAYVASVVELLIAGGLHLHFGTAVAILWFITLGHALEHKARRSAASAIDGLRSLAPEFATVIRNGDETQMRIEDVPEGAVVLVKPGGRVPLDGLVKQGESTINQAMITGESEPVEVAQGDSVFAGTINQTGSLRITVTATGAQTLLGQIVEMVEQAQGNKAGIQRLADKVAGVFVPVVVLIALGTLLGWGVFDSNWSRGLTACVAVLIVACPCALGLAVPTAILVGTGIGAKRGILIKDPAALERSHGLTHVILDKTGTLTTGRPTVTAVYCHDAERDERQLLRLAAAAEQDSEHPLAKAIIDDARAQGVDVPPATKFKSATAAGVTASVEGRVVKVGRLSALREQGVAVPDGFEADREARLPGARTIVAVAIDNKAVGLIGLADQIRPEADEALAALNKLGLRTVMMTGDSQFAADRVARQLKIDRTFAEVKPADKRQKLLDLQVGNKLVVMVGDGINDAPALAEADLGIAIGGGTDIARDAGHVVLVGSDLRQLATTIRLGRSTMRRIIAGLLWASIYNVCLIPLAATGLLHPMYAALAMSLSSVSVVINALWLRWTWRG